jgi:hypothetical protein
MPKIRKSTSLKFAAVAIGVAGIVGLTISSASSLNLAGGTVAAATTTVASCQTSTTGQVTVNFGNTYSTATPAGYNVTSIALGNVDPGCKGQLIKVTLTAAGTVLGEFVGTVPTTVTAPASVTLTPSASNTGTIPAATVDGTAVVIYN